MFIMKTKKIVDSQKNKFMEMDHSISLLIENSSDIRENSLIYANEESDEIMKNEAISKMKIFINQLQKQRFENDSSLLDDLKNHLLVLHQTLFDTLKKVGHLNSEIINIEKKWKKKCEGIFAEKENEKREKAEIIDQGRKKIKASEESIENLRAQLSKETKERDLQIDFLNKELKKNVNLEYIRNIIINFLTNKDFTVREKLLPVLATVLQFSTDELDTVKTMWEKEHFSFLSKGSASVSNWLNNRLFNSK